ncbi:MAG: YraN family protein [Leptolyngbyaceae cyanobacterium bins.59]|nr:YraN family protein [Leptolyngbyaceae cyanobacterium bins.59]
MSRLPPDPSSEPIKNSLPKRTIGNLGENLVARWLEEQGWTILHRQWHSRWGEIDLIAQAEKESHTPVLAFVEVKTRSQGNWDEDGLLAMTPTKQKKLIQTARLFLAKYPLLAEQSCRFDVALVLCHGAPRSPTKESQRDQGKLPSPSEPIKIGQAVSIEGHQLILQDYIPWAFEPQ